jgi:hypothetical protein
VSQHPTACLPSSSNGRHSSHHYTVHVWAQKQYVHSSGGCFQHVKGCSAPVVMYSLEWPMSCCLLVLVSCCHCSNPAFEPPASEDDLQVAYEAALWHLLGFFFLEYDDLDRGAFPEVRTARI